jgi:apolipoprotein D and lipocalin family protein
LAERETSIVELRAFETTLAPQNDSAAAISSRADGRGDAEFCVWTFAVSDNLGRRTARGGRNTIRAGANAERAGCVAPDMNARIASVLALLALSLLGSSCTTGSSPAAPVKGFEADRYLGRWYEVARLPHRFERGLSDVTAEYSMNDDGTIRVVNRGWSVPKREWKSADGRAKFTSTTDVGQLKVSFFGPFYGLYTVAELDPDYRWAMVVGPGTGYFWVLSRTPGLDEATLARLTSRAAELGIDAAKIERVTHERAAARDVSK